MRNTTIFLNRIVWDVSAGHSPILSYITGYLDRSYSSSSYIKATKVEVKKKNSYIRLQSLDPHKSAFL